MKPIYVSGLINIETTLRIDAFPVPYMPVRYPFFGVQTTVSGVGYNIAKALTVLGDPVHFAALIGRDPNGALVRAALDEDGIDDRYIIAGVPQTAQSVILYDEDGRRQINVDLKNIQETTYPEAQFAAAAGDCDLLVLCNINYSRPYLARGKGMGKRIATDVHTIGSLDDDYNADFMAHADILFMSDESLPMAPADWARAIFNRYGPAVVVIGLGARGALLAVRDDNFVEVISPVVTRPVVNTIGAGDALFSAFVHTYNQTGDPYLAIRKAIVFASYKIGESGAASGFIDSATLEALYNRAMN
jgi:ribokinase